MGSPFGRTALSYQGSPRPAISCDVGLRCGRGKNQRRSHCTGRLLVPAVHRHPTVAVHSMAGHRQSSKQHQNCSVASCVDFRGRSSDCVNSWSGPGANAPLCKGSTGGCCIFNLLMLLPRVSPRARFPARFSVRILFRACFPRARVQGPPTLLPCQGPRLRPPCTTVET
eukprot:gene18807-biopygen21985